MNFLSSKNFSLACAVFNAIFCIGSLLAGNVLFAAISGGFSAWCYRNYLEA